MSIKTTKRIVLALISSLVFAPFAVVAPASAATQPIRIIEAEPDATSYRVGDTVKIQFSGEVDSDGMDEEDTFSVLLTLDSPSGSDIELDDRNGSSGGNIYTSEDADAVLETPNVTANGTRVTFEVDDDAGAGVLVPPFDELILGTLNFVPDEPGDYVFAIKSTNAAGAASGDVVEVTITVDDEIVFADLDAGAFSLWNEEDGSLYDSYYYRNNGVNYVTLYSEDAEDPDTEDGLRTVFAEIIWTNDSKEDGLWEFAANFDGYDYQVATDRELIFTITGPAVWDEEDFNDEEVSRDYKVVTYEAGDTPNSYSDLDILDKGIVTIAVTVKNTSTGRVTSIGKYVMEFVSEPKAGTYSAADSFAQLQIEPTELTEIPSPKIDVVGASTRPNTGTAYLAMYLRDVYDGPIYDTSTVLIATATNGALVAWEKIPTTSTAVLDEGLSTAILWIRQGTASSTTVEVKLNDTVVATKTVTWSGAASTIAISSKKVSVPVSASTAAFKYALSDAAGNRVTGTVTAEFDGVYILDAEVASSSATAARDVTVTCSALRGKGSVTLTYASTKTETVEVICAGGIASFEVATNKAAYERGEIGVFTITAKDLAGNPVPDGTDLASAASKIQFTGTGASFAKGAAPVVFTDEFTDGKIDYAFTASTTAGSYSYALWHADLSPAVTKVAQFTVNAPAVAPTYVTPTLTRSIEGARVLLFGACSADEGDMVVYVKTPGGAWKERAKTLECVAGEFEGSIKAPKITKYFRVKQEGTGLWSPSVLVRR
jgi:hypothetical protein